jgi:hypothetical protein
MSVGYIAALKSTRMQAVTTSLDTGAGTATLDIGTAGMALVLCSIALAKPSFTESGGVITMAGAPKSGTASQSGTAAAARIRDAGGTNQTITGLTVGTSGTDIVLNSTSITNGQTITMNSLTITHAP